MLGARLSPVNVPVMERLALGFPIGYHGGCCDPRFGESRVHSSASHLHRFPARARVRLAAARRSVQCAAWVLAICSAIPACRVHALDEGSRSDFVGFNCGGSARTGSGGLVYAADVAAGPDGAGYIGGSVSGGFTDIQGTSDSGLYYQRRDGEFAYRFIVSPGEYLLWLHFMEVAVFGPGQRRFRVVADRDTLFADLDLMATVGKHRALETVRLIHCASDTLRVSFEGIVGGATLSAIGLSPATISANPPPAPLGLTVVESYGLNALHWERPAGAPIRGHRVYAAGAGAPLVPIGENPFLDGRFCDWSAVPGVRMAYQVAAVDAWGREGARSEVVQGAAHHWSESALPVYRLDLAAEEIDTLNAHATEDEEVPAHLTWSGGSAPVEVRYRGELFRHLHKKSWKIRLPDGVAIDSLQTLDLKGERSGEVTVAEALAFALLDSLGLQHRASVPVHLEVNGEYAGLFARVEPMEERYLARRHLRGNLYKCDDVLRAYFDPAAYWLRYEKKNGDPDFRDDLITFIDALNYLDTPDLARQLPEIVDLDQVLRVYALLILTRQPDVYQRNFCLFHDLDRGLWELVPFDLDRGFGSQPVRIDEGTTDPTDPGVFNVLLDRLMEVPQLRWAHAHNLRALANGVCDPQRIHALAEELLAQVRVDGERDVEKRDLARNEWFLGIADRVAAAAAAQQTHLEEQIAEFLEGTPAICINEAGQIPTASMDPDLWVELYNFGDDSVAVGNYVVGPSSARYIGWSLPETTLAPGGRLLVVPGHIPGWLPRWSLWQELALYDAQQVLRDAILRAPDAGGAQGRVPDGGLRWQAVAPTPGSMNPAPAGCRVRELLWWPEYPDLDDTLRFEVVLDTLHAGARAADLLLSRAGHGTETLGLQADGAWRWHGVRLPLGVGSIITMRVAVTDSSGNTVVTPESEAWRQQVAALALPEICVNEFLALNQNGLRDEAGQCDDWVELYNRGSSSVALGGMWMSDERSEPDKWALPAIDLGPREFLLIWADRDLDQGALHADFKLSGDGEQIVLSLPSRETVDAHDFGPQVTDRSEGRWPDGERTWRAFASPTPGTWNAPAPVPPSAAPGLRVTPCPARGGLSFVFPAQAGAASRVQVFAVDGRRVRTLQVNPEDRHAGSVVWDGLDAHGAAVPSGVYFAIFEASGARCRLVILRTEARPS